MPQPSQAPVCEQPPGFLPSAGKTPPKFSEVFRLALAHLSPSDFSDHKNLTEYTCCAISLAINRLNNPAVKYAAVYGMDCVTHPARNYYPLADVPVKGGFDEFSPGLERQSARFLWLCLLAEIAESEGN